MEGRPWLRILVILIGFSLLGLPVWSMTRTRGIAAPVKVETRMSTRPLRVKITFAQAPASFELKYLGAVLCHGGAPQREFSCDWKAAVPKEGADLLLKADWPAGTSQTAVRLEVTENGEPLVDTTFWSDGSLVETITVPGK